MKNNIPKNAGSGCKLLQPQNMEYWWFIEDYKIKLTFFLLSGLPCSITFTSATQSNLLQVSVTTFEPLHWIRINNNKYHKNSAENVGCLINSREYSLVNHQKTCDRCPYIFETICVYKDFWPGNQKKKQKSKNFGRVVLELFNNAGKLFFIQ